MNQRQTPPQNERPLLARWAQIFVLVSIIVSIATLFWNMYESAKRDKTIMANAVQQAEATQALAEGLTRSRIYKAWDVIGAGEGKKSSAGRILALEELIDLNQSLKGVNLSHAMLDRVNLSDANLKSANFDSSSLNYAILKGAVLVEARLKGADLLLAQLEDTVLVEVNLDGAILRMANLERANLRGANLNWTDLGIANLAGSIDWRSAKIVSPINLFNFHGTPAGFESKEAFKVWAASKGAVFLPPEEWHAFRDSVLAEEAK